jgi:integrase
MVFTTPIGTPIDPDNLTKAYKAMLSRAGLRDQRFHDLRHAAATLMLRDGLPVHEVSAVLGHSQTSTTLNVYSHVLPGGNDRAAAAMDRLLG